MSSSSQIRFSRSCPTCGRRVQITANLLGREVACRHCNASFIATSGDDNVAAIERAQRLLERVDTLMANPGRGAVHSTTPQNAV